MSDLSSPGARSTVGPPPIVLWGTYDLGNPRIRILIRGLREAGAEPIACHADVWAGVADKSRIGGRRRLAGRAIRWLAAYPSLIWRYLRLPPHRVVLVGYLGHLDVLMLWPLARLRGARIIWDAFLSLYETVVEDRAMIGPRHPAARLLWAWDWLACRAADRVLLDTEAHARWFAAAFGLPGGRTAAVFAGVEPDAFAPLPTPAARQPGAPLRILFYGSFIALHGIETIVAAAAQGAPGAFAWTLIGDGQEAPRIRRLLDANPVADLEWIGRVPYRELRQRIAAADICLGIFGRSGKAGRVIPYKVFQIVAAGRPFVTRDSPAIRELVGPDAAGVRLVPPGDPAALLAAISELAKDIARPGFALAFDEMRKRILPATLGRQLVDLAARLTAQRDGE